MNQSVAPQIKPLLDFIAEKDEAEPLLIEPFFPDGGIGFFHGKGGLGKSFVAASMMRAVADGTNFIHPTFRCIKGRVVYIQADMTAGTQRERMKKAVKTIMCPENVFIVQWGKKFNILHEIREQAEWLYQLQALEPKLIIVDTVRKTNSLPENENDTPSTIYEAWKNVCPSAAFLFIAHDNKDMAMDSRDHDDRARGARAWIDDADFGMRLVKHGKVLKIAFSKTRTCERPHEFPIFIDNETAMAYMDVDAKEIAEMFVKFKHESNRSITRRLLESGRVGLKERQLMRRIAELRGADGTTEEDDEV